MSFSIWLRDNRNAKGLTLLGLSAKADTSHTTIQRLESGERYPSRDMVIKIANALEVDVNSALFAAGFLPANALEFVRNSDELELLTLYRSSRQTRRVLDVMRALVQEKD